MLHLFSVRFPVSKPISRECSVSISPENKETRGFLTFSGGLKMDHWHEWGNPKFLKVVVEVKSHKKAISYRGSDIYSIKMNMSTKYTFFKSEVKPNKEVTTHGINK